MYGNMDQISEQFFDQLVYSVMKLSRFVAKATDGSD